MKYIITLLLLASNFTLIFAQCECTDCPIFVPSNTTQSSELDISGSTNSTLGSNGQQLCQVCIILDHDAIDEIDMILIAPDGSSIDLISESGLSSGQDLTFEICFLSCDQSADPDPGHAATFDSSENWGSNATYDGTYYPSAGCLEDLTGDVNGEWEIEITDFVGLDDGTLQDWYLVFADDAGLDCANADDCDLTPPSCLAEGGELNEAPLIACEGDTELNIDIDPTFPNNNEPPIPDFDYSWIIVNADTDVIEDISSSSDLTSYPPGSYLLCGLSFLVNDEPLIPGPDGSLTIEDIDDDIDDEDYCADLSNDCMEITIDPDVVEPDFDGPTTVCADEINTYTILDYDPSIIYLVSFTGSVSFFSGNDDTYEIAWSSGPAQICALIESACGDVETCIDVEVGGSPLDLEIIGEFEPCPGSIETYTFEPEPEVGESYDVTISGGTIINQTDDSVEIEWPETEGTQEICIELIGGICPGSPLCEDIEVELDFEIPDELDSPEELCEGLVGISEVNGSNDVLQYIWTVTNLEIIDGQNTETLEYIGDGLGLATVCLEIITNCGSQGPICEEIDILEVPEPNIEEVDPTCNLTFILISDANPNNEINWTLEDGPGDADIEDPNETTTEVTVSQPGIYQFQIDEINESCSESEQITIEILSDLDISDPTFECNLDNEYSVTFTILNGESPYYINGAEISGDVFTSDYIESEEEYEFEILDDIGCSTIIEDDFTCPCISDAGNMIQDPILICIQDETFFLGIWENDGIFDNNDVGTYFLHDEDDDDLGDVFDFNDTGEFEYNENYELGIEYYISYVVGNDDGSGFADIDDECLSVSEGQPVIFYDLPLISFEYETATCENEILISGEWDDDEISINWSKVSGPGTVIFSNSSGIPTLVEVSEQGQYIIEAELDNLACSNKIEIELDFTITPEIINISESCNNAADFYTVSFEVLNGTGPFSASVPGSFTNNIFTSDLIPTGQPYNINVTDINGCNSRFISGNKLCDCISDSGFMNSNLITVCVTEDSIVAIDVVDNVLDNDDIGFYYLHTSSTNILGDVISTNSVGTFYFASSIVLDSVYYVSYIVGNNNGGLIDFSDPCLDITYGQPVMWNSAPVSNAGTDQSTCDGQLSLNAIPNNGNWQCISAPPNSILINFTSSNSNEDISLDLEGDYLFEWQTMNGNCIAKDTVLYTKNASPSVTNISTECSLDLLTYNLEFDIIDSALPLMVNGLTTGNLFQTSNLNVNETIDFLVTNNFGCMLTIQVGPIICDCNSEVGTINNQEQNLCSFDLIDINISNGDFILEDGDTLAYILHDGTDTDLGNVLAISYGENIPFGNNMSFNTTYFLNVAIANNINNEIDLSDVCLQLSNGVPIIFSEELNASINDNLEGCIGDQVSFNVTSNIYPFDITIINNIGDVMTQNILDENTLITIDIRNLQETWMIDDINNECLNSINGEVNILGQEPTVFELNSGFEICNNEFFGSTVLIEDLFVGDIPPGEWQLNGVIINGENLEFKDLLPGDYNLIYSNIGFDELCGGMTDDITFTVIECNCAIFNNPDINICSDNIQIPLSDFDTQNILGEWSIINNNNSTSPPEIQNDNIVVGLEDEGLFEIIFNINDPNYPFDCDQSTSFQLNIENYSDAGQQTNFPVFCEDEIVNINLFDYLSTSDLNGNWSLNNTQVNGNSIDISLLDFGDYIFTYTLDNSTICPISTADVIITIEELPQVSLTSNNVLCYGFSDGEIIITIENENGETVECYLNNELQPSGKAITDLEPGTYQVYVRRGECESEVQNIIITEPNPVTVELGDDKEIEINSEITINAIVNIIDSDIGQISWADLSGILEIDALELTSIFENDNTISILITDTNGCIAEDEINIRVNDPPVIINEIYIPNTFSPQTSDSNNKFGMQNIDHVASVNKFYIFDRWGNKVYAQENLSPSDENIYWDGYFNNQLAIQGVYVYMIEVTYLSNESEIFAGDITLVR